LAAQEITLQSPELVRRLVLVGKAALFLVSDDSSFVTGIELFVDGGRAQI
jgi:enoyl-[acyl-carrier-protein] reductase (NADH)